jgi:hypothetical protein
MFILYSGSDHFIEVADIGPDLQVKSSKPISEDTLIRLNKYITDKIINKGVLKFEKEIFPDNLIYFDGSEMVVWYEKPSKRKLFFSKKESFEYNLPGIVFMLKNGKLSVFLTDDKKINNNSKLYPNVFPNTYGDYSICIGNNKPKVFNKISELIKYYTDFLFESEFTAGFRGNMEKYFIQSREKKFPKEFFEKEKYILMKELL